MGYWSTNGSYVYDEYDNHEYVDKVSQAKEQALREYEAEKARQAREYYDRKKAEEFERHNSYTEPTLPQTTPKTTIAPTSSQEEIGVPHFVSNPQTLADRRARANYWMRYSAWSTFKASITGKRKKFDALFDEFSDADPERKAAIVDEMERMFPPSKYDQGGKSR